MTLIYYHNEWEEFSHEFDIYLDKEQIKKISKKLIRHFKLYNIEKVTFNSVRKGHCRYFKSNPPWCIVDVPSKTSLGLICHELAHAFELLKYKKAGHSKKHKHLMKRIVTYCRKKDYWDLDKK